MEPQTQPQQSRFSLAGIPLGIILALTLLLPIALVPSAGLLFLFSKGALLALGVALALVAVLVSALRRGTLGILMHPLVLSMGLVSVAVFVSALISAHPDLSFVGYRLEPDTAFFTLLAVALGLLAAIHIVSRRSFRLIFTAFLVAWLIVAGHVIFRLFVGFDTLAFGVLSQPTGNLLGRWNDVGIMTGLAVIISLLLLARPTLPLSRTILLVGAVIIGLFLSAVVNFTNVLVVMAVAGLLVAGFFFFRRFLDRSAGPLTGQQRLASVIALVVAVVSTVLAFQPSIGNNLASSYGIAQLEARPSWQSTFDIARAVYTENPLFGSGPNTFSLEWVKHKPSEVNESLFWNVDFASGVGHIPTAFVTGGLVVGIPWALFLLLFLLVGFIFLSRTYRGGSGPHTLFAGLSFVAAFYLWLFSIIYTPSVVLVAFAFLFTGVFIAALRLDGLTGGERVVSIDFRERQGLMGSALALLVLIIAGTSLYFVGARYTAGAYYQAAVNAGTVSGDLERANRLLRSALSISATDEYLQSGVDLALARLGQIAQGEATAEAQQQFQQVLNEAIAYGNGSVALNPDNYRNWLAAARVYQAVVPFQVQGAYDNAKATLDQALVVAPNNPDIHLLYAQLEAANNDFDAAREHIAEALRIKSNYTAAIFFRAQIEVTEGNVRQAIQSLETAVSLSPGDPTLFFALGFLRYNDGNYGGAIEALEQAVILNNNYSNALYFLGLAYEQQDRRDDAVAVFELISQLNPDNQEVKDILANLRAGKAPFGDSDIAPENRDNPPIEGE